MGNQDHSYKSLFSHPRIVQDLLENFVGGRWLTEVDFSTLERVSGNHMSDDLRERIDDMIWRVRWRDGHVYILLEFQSGPEHLMAVRVLSYVALMYEELARSTGRSEPRGLGAILPLVLHSGASRWRAPDEVDALLAESPTELVRYRPQLRYLLIDECQFEDDVLAQRNDFVSLLFRFENCRSPDRLPGLVEILWERVTAAEQPALRRSFETWIDRVICARLRDRAGALIAFDQLKEKSMLSERFDMWEREFLRKGREEGLATGREEGKELGRREGEQLLLLRQLQKRFGVIPEGIRATLQAASPEQLESWADRLLDARNLDEVFAARE